MADKDPIPTELNTNVAHPARVYDYWLGGKDNFAADREVAEKVLAIVPEIPQSARANRLFLKRAVQIAARAGIRQFLDIGSGLPTVENTHAIAQREAPEARVVYVDNDPIVSVHGLALLASTGSTAVVQADLRDLDGILRHSDVRRLIDFEQPVGVLLLGVFHFVADEDGPYRIMARLRDAMAPGSYLMFSHFTGDADPEIGEQFGAAVNREARAVPRTRDQVERFFDGFDILDPGIVPPDRWRPEYPGGMDRFWLWAGVASRNSRP